MSDSQLIFNYLNKEHLNSQTIFFLYVSAVPRSAEYAKCEIFESLVDVFTDVIPDNVIQKTIYEFLEFKKKEYSLGKITYKPFY